MIDLIKREIAAHGGLAEVVPIAWLEKLTLDIEQLKKEPGLPEATRPCLDEWYDFKLPTGDFTVKSLVVTLTPSPIAEITFVYRGQPIPLLLPPVYVDRESNIIQVEGYLRQLLTPHRRQIKAHSRLPRKILAARCGLIEYGRNNLGYAEGLGSFFRIETFLSDIDCPDVPWQEIKRLESCQKCRICLNRCPGRAILADTLLVDVGRCLTWYNEEPGDFPAWLDPESHNCVVGCLKCQEKCPHNREVLHKRAAPALFAEEETAAIMAGQPYQLLPEGTAQKISDLGLRSYYGLLPRNLQVLFAQKELI